MNRQRIVVMGGGKLAYHLIQALYREGLQISVVEQGVEHGEAIANRFERVEVFHGDGTTITVLEEAGCREADFFVAVTGNDEDNLVGCLIAKKYFGVRTTLARVNNPRNLEMFRRLDVDRVFNSTLLIADLIESIVRYRGMRVVSRLPNSEDALLEVRLSEAASAVGRRLGEIKLPGSAAIVLLVGKGGQRESPRSERLLLAGDTLFVAASPEQVDEIYDRLVRH